MSKTETQSLAKYKSPKGEFQCSWNPKNDLTSRYPILDENDKNLAKFVISLEKRPTVILIGWIGSTPKNLARYVKVYNSKQIDAIWLNPPNINHFNQTWFREYSRSFLDFLISINYDRPTFFHIFSGNFICFSHMVGLILQEPVLLYDHHILTIQKYHHFKSLMIGQIYDSCPGDINFTSEGAINSLAGYLTQLHSDLIFSGSKSRILLGIASTIMKTMEIICDVKKLNEEHLERMDDIAICPMIFFYSKNDNFITWQEVEAFMKRYRDKVDMEGICWEKSVHVNHISVHKEEYTSRLRKFLEKCIKKSSNKVKAKL